jgi:4-diphosphocytidyl-2-C-methyl-D-erythritol kinase
LCNDLESTAVQMCPRVTDMKRALMALGAQGALMAGSGPTVFGLFPNAAAAGGAAFRLARDRDWWVKRSALRV